MGILQRARPLKNCRHFADLAERNMREVCRAGQEVTVPERWSFIWENTPGDRAYLLLDGRASVLVGGQQIAELGPGDLVGEVALRNHRLRTAAVTAQTPLTLLSFTKETFDDLYARIPTFRDAVDAAVTARTGDSAAS
ncbi:MAG TPA: cyclic nucleotide-binding domain-containing protein [Nocardioidaceae bacterium]|nr:cyclic nucleotide-binding domain-containing protein [Nocardioidaceae bacterium]